MLHDSKIKKIAEKEEIQCQRLLALPHLHYMGLTFQSLTKWLKVHNCVYAGYVLEGSVTDFQADKSPFRIHAYLYPTPRKGGL